MDRANQLIADENRRMQIEVVPALEDRALNRFNTGEAQKRQSWMDKVNALQAQYGITNDDVNRWNTRVNNAQTLGQNQTNWQATYDQTTTENKLNRDFQSAESEKARQAQAAQNAATLKEQQRQFDVTMAWNKTQAEKAAAAAASSAGGGSSSGGISGGTSKGGKSSSGKIPDVKADSTADVNKMITSNKTFFTEDPNTKAVVVNKAMLPQISAIIKESRLPYWEKKKLFANYGIQSGINQIDADTNLKRVKANPQEFLNGLIGAFEKGQIDENTFYRRVTHYGLLPLLTGR